MSKRHPIIAATGSSGAGTTTVKRAFTRIFDNMGLAPAIVEGDCFHAYERPVMLERQQQARIRSENFSHFGPAANLFDKLEKLFSDYGKSGEGLFRHYIHNEDEAAQHLNIKSGQFTEWENIQPGTDLLFYEGLHGGVTTEEVDVAKHVDLLLGVVPTINLEWSQKIWRDVSIRSQEHAAVKANILARMYDYVTYIVPQFSRTHINFQRVPMTDTSNPFAVRDIPSQDESMVVVRIREPKLFNVDFPYLLSMIHNSFMSAPDTLVLPGGKMGLAIEVILTPIIEELMAERGRENLLARYAKGPISNIEKKLSK